MRELDLGDRRLLALSRRWKVPSTCLLCSAHRSCVEDRALAGDVVWRPCSCRGGPNPVGLCVNFQGLASGCGDLLVSSCLRAALTVSSLEPANPEGLLLSSVSPCPSCGLLAPRFIALTP